MAVVRLTSMEALILSVTVYIDPRPPADRRQAAVCSSAYWPLLADQRHQWCTSIPAPSRPPASSHVLECLPATACGPPVSGCGQPQTELHSLHSFLYFPIGTNVIGLLCTSYKYRKRFKQGAESLLVADWSKISHLNKRLGEPAASAGSFPPYDGFTFQC